MQLTVPLVIRAVLVWDGHIAAALKNWTFWLYATNLFKPILPVM